MLKKNNWLQNAVIAMLVLIVGLCINMGSGTKVQAESIQRPTPINQVFPDPGLANAVKQNLGKQSVTDLVSQKELSGVQNFNGDNSNIQSLAGMQFFTNLKELHLSHNQISDLSPLKDLTKLEELSVNRNRLRNLNGIPSACLSRLFLDNNELRDTDSLIHLKNLEILSIRNNKLKSIVMLGFLSKLEVLDLHGNEITNTGGLTRLKKVNWIDLTGQKCVNEPVKYQPELYITNTVKDPDGRWISPYYISNGGSYVDGCVLWELPVYTDEVSYKFSEYINVGETEAIFDGTVTQPIKN